VTRRRLLLTLERSNAEPAAAFKSFEPSTVFPRAAVKKSATPVKAVAALQATAFTGASAVLV